MANGFNPSFPSLKRCFRMREAITITVGTVIGVGLFTVGANAVGVCGPYIFFATLAALLVSIYPALLYAEMGAALPFAGGTYQYASLGLSRPFGMLAGWSFIISMVSVASGEALAFGFYIQTLFDALGLPLPVSDTVIACAAVFLFLVFNFRGVQLSGRLQNGFMFFFWGVTIVWFFSMTPYMGSANFSLAAGGEFSFSSVLPCVAMVWWCFAGFETCCAMGEEIRYPQINLPRALFLAPFIVFIVNALFQWVLLAIVPSESLSSLAAASAPYADAMRLAGAAGFPLVLLCLGIAFGGDFSTLNASLAAPARYLYTMSRDGVLPRFLSRLHPKFQTPVPALLILGGCMAALILTGSIVYISSLSLFATLLYYIIGIAAAWRLRKTRLALTRPYRAPLICVGAPVSIAAYALMMTQLDLSAVLSGVAWCLLGLFLYAICSRKYDGREIAALPALPEAPPLEERRRMDREFKIWVAVVAGAGVLVVGLYLIFFFL